MITSKRIENEYCSCCFSTTDVVEFQFNFRDGNASTIRLCRDCQDELAQLLHIKNMEALNDRVSKLENEMEMIRDRSDLLRSSLDE